MERTWDKGSDDHLPTSRFNLDTSNGEGFSTGRTVSRVHMRGFLQLARPLNCVMSAVGVAIAGIVASRVEAVVGVAYPLGLACVSAAIFTAGGEALKDILLPGNDQVEQPQR